MRKPLKALPIVILSLLPLVCAGLGAIAALRQPLLQSYRMWSERRQDDAGWLPRRQEVIAVRGRKRELSASGDDVWHELRIPDSAIPELLDCLAHRKFREYPKRPPGAPLVYYDREFRVVIELTTAARRKPASIGLVRSHLAWIGNRLMVIPAADGDRLGELIRHWDETSGDDATDER